MNRPIVMRCTNARGDILHALRNGHNGATPGAIRAVTGATAKQFSRAISELRSRGLVHPRGTRVAVDMPRWPRIHDVDTARILRRLRRGPRTVSDLAHETQNDPAVVRKLTDKLIHRGFVHAVRGVWLVSK